ncbi:MAG TPA: cell division protein FtsQ/DivIB [Solirubrobacterales bacterium]
MALVLLGVLAAGLLYRLALRDTTVEAQLSLPRATATIGTGPGAVGVGADGTILRWLPPPPPRSSLPELPLSSAPNRARLSGTMLQQARVLGAAPAALRPHLRRSSYGESGIDVELRSGIELRFGDASRAAEKWRAAAAVLADPSITTLGYVDLHAPRRPAVGGSGHALPALP